MKTHSLLCLVSASSMLSVPLHAASIVTPDFTLFQEYSVGPNALAATPGWIDYRANLRDAVTSSGFVNAGDSLTPGYYSIATGTVPLSQMVSTGPGVSTPTARYFNSWHGQANPGSAFGAAFANEYGNFLYTPLLLVTTGGAVTITSIDRIEYSVALKGDASPWKTGSWATFNNSRVGVKSFGGDGVLGGGDDVYTTSGETMASTPVVAFFAIGAGNALDLKTQLNGSPWPESTPDEAIFPAYFTQWGDSVLDYRVDYTVNYMKDDVPSVVDLPGDDVEVVPEPSSLGLGALACLFFLNRRRRPQQ